MSAHTFSDIDFHSRKFINVTIDNEDYSNRNILIIKDSLYDTTKSANIIPVAAKDYKDVMFLYVGAQISIEFSSTNKQVFKASTAYRCVLDTTTSAYKWEEFELGGSAKWNTVDINKTTDPTETEFKDTPATSKAGTQYRVLSTGLYTLEYDSTTSKTKDRATLGDVIICTSTNDDGSNAKYAIIPSGDDVDYQELAISSIPDTGDFTFTNNLGTSDVTVTFFVLETMTDGSGSKVIKTPFICDYYVTPYSKDETTQAETLSTIICHVDTIPTKVHKDTDSVTYTADKIAVLIHC
jgi:hypothetical protein